AVSRRRAVHLPLGLRTVGELVLYSTCFREHRGSGYRWTANEVATKVRLVLAESLGVPLDAVRPENTLAEMGGVGGGRGGSAYAFGRRDRRARRVRLTPPRPAGAALQSGPRSRRPHRGPAGLLDAAEPAL